MLRVFISYSRANFDLLKELLIQLDAAKAVGKELDYWYDKEPEKGIVAGDSWKAILTQQIRLAHVFAIFLTADAVASRPCQDELSIARQLGKRIVQIKVTPTPLVENEASCIPNSSDWVGLEPNKQARQGLWSDVSNELLKVQRPIPKISQSKSAFDHFYRLVTQFHTFKSFHDIAHGLYEPYFKDLINALQVKYLSDRERGDCISAIKEAIVNLEGTLETKRDFVEVIATKTLQSLVKSLEVLLALLDEDVNLESRDHASMKFGISIFSTTAELCRCLTYFNKCMREIADSFDPERFRSAVDEVLLRQRNEDSRFKELLSVSDPFFSQAIREHDALQSILDVVQGIDPDELFVETKRRRFIQRWENSFPELTPYIEKWGEETGTSIVSDGRRGDAKRLHQKLKTLDGQLRDIKDVDDPTNEQVRPLQRALQDFTSVFDPYFLALDRTLRDKYKRLQADLHHLVEGATT